MSVIVYHLIKQAVYVLTSNVCTETSENKCHERILCRSNFKSDTEAPAVPVLPGNPRILPLFFFSLFLLISVGFPSGEKGSYSFLVFFLKSPWMHFPCSDCEVLQTLVLWYKHYFYNHRYSSTRSIIQENIHLDISYCCHYDSVTGWSRAGPPPGGFYLCCPVN